MITMQLKYVGTMKPSELLEGDLVKIDEEIVEIKSITDDATGDFYFIEYVDDYGDVEVAQINYLEPVEFFVLVDD